MNILDLVGMSFVVIVICFFLISLFCPFWIKKTPKGYVILERNGLYTWKHLFTKYVYTKSYTNIYLARESAEVHSNYYKKYYGDAIEAGTWEQVEEKT